MDETGAKKIIYSDLDGTLLDYNTYSFDITLPAIKHAIELDIPLILCTAKTKAEITYYLGQFGIDTPFVAENGSAIFIPRPYFDFEIRDFTTKTVSETGQYYVILLGKPVSFIRDTLITLKDTLKLDFKLFGDLSIAQISEITQLSPEAAERASQRDFSEGILQSNMSKKQEEQLRKELQFYNLSIVSGGHFNTVVGSQSNKGMAVRILNRMFKKENTNLKTFGLGDNINDIPMLKAVNHAYIVQHNDGSIIQHNLNNAEEVHKIGPTGWRQAFDKIVAA